eukprot:scaffold23186_cov112-Isochrysis_galbana.AAC.2
MNRTKQETDKEASNIRSCVNEHASNACHAEAAKASACSGNAMPATAAAACTDCRPSVSGESCGAAAKLGARPLCTGTRIVIDAR